ncbi:MAG: phage head morphogenesis protein [Eubacterium sp.]|nr:phage head morphogenesis protein [Eubacterium sp.]
MTKQEKEIAQILLDHEKEIMKLLRDNYTTAIAEVKEKIAILSLQNEDLQSKIYQRKWQEELERILTDILQRMNDKNYQSIEEYLNDVAQDSFLGSVYSLHQNNIPIRLMINERLIANMINTPVDGIKLSERLYKNTKELKKKVVAEISRGFATGKSYQDMAKELSNKMISPFSPSYNQALRIARTEGARVNNATAFEAMKKAKKFGLDIVKQWDSTLDNRTRPHHRRLDGQIKEIEEYFEVGGNRALYPCGFGIASEDINCRCFAVMRVRSAVKDDYTKWDGENNKLVHLKAAQNYNDWKEIYLNE